MNELVCDYYKDNIRYTAYRWYFKVQALNWASQNGVHYHGWIIRLKNDSNNGDFTVHHFFEQILVDYIRHSDVDIDLIISIPPSTSYKEHPSYPLASIAATVNKYCGFDNSGHYKHYIKRLSTISKKTHSFDKNRTSMVVEDLINCKKSILLIDDVMTTGSTLEAAASLISEKKPDVQILTFAFGKTQPTGSTPFPEEPKFPNPEETNPVKGIDGEESEEEIKINETIETPHQEEDRIYFSLSIIDLSEIVSQNKHNKDILKKVNHELLHRKTKKAKKLKEKVEELLG
tara:strand:- start:252 stop:1115 length:864 start_codon:yes stop_codon:yes gene_type:complete